MKLLISLLVFTSAFFTRADRETPVLEQSILISEWAGTLDVQLPGAVHVEYWEQPSLLVHTHIQGSPATPFAMEYATQQKHYQLHAHPRLDECTVTLRPEKVNTTLFSDGQIQRTKQHYTLYVPAHLRVRLAASSLAR